MPPAGAHLSAPLGLWLCELRVELDAALVTDGRLSPRRQRRSMLNHAGVTDIFDSGQSFFRLRNAGDYTENDSAQSNLLDTFVEVEA